MRTLNVRLAVSLLVIIVVCGTGIYFAHIFQQKRNANFFLEQAELAKQEVEQAKKDKNTTEEEKALQKQFRNMEMYLMFKPGDLDVMESFGMLRADHISDNRSFSQAFGILEKVVREDETRNKARRKLIELMMPAGRSSDAMEHINYLLKESPDDPDLLQLLGQCEAEMGEDSNAVATYEKAIKYSPKQIETYARLADLLRNRLEQPKEAYECMQNMINNNPNSVKAYFYLGLYWQSINSKEEAKKATDKDLDPKEEAMKAAEKALELAPDDTDGLLLASHCAMALGDLEKARKFAERNMEIHKESPQIYITLADIIVRSGNRAKAIEILDQGLKDTKNSPQILWSKANLLIDLRKMDAAKETIEKLQSTSYPKILLEYLDARIVFAEKNWAEASRRFEKIRPSLSVGPALLMQVDLCLGYCYGQLHNVDQQIRSYQRVLASDPFNGPARQGLTDALLASGRVDEAVQEYYNLIQMKKVPPSGLITFASLLIRQNLQQSSDEQNWNQVDKIIDQAEKANPDADQIPLLRTEVLNAQNRTAEAEIVLQKAHDKKPKQVEFWNAMVTLAALQKKWDKAEKILADYQQQMGDTVDLRLARSEYLLRRYNADAGEHLKKLNENIDGFSDADRVRLWNGLLSAARRSSNADLGKYLIDLLAQKDVNNLEVQFLRVEEAATKSDPAALEECLNDLKKIEGEGPLWLYGQARLLSMKAKDNNPEMLDKALQNLVKARELRPSWSRIPLFMAAIYDQQKKTDQALKCFREAINMGEHNPAAVRRTVQILFQQQRYSEADKLLRQLDRLQAPFTPELTRLWVQLLIQQGEFDLAMAKARQAVSEKSDDYSEHLWLGQILGIAARRANVQKRSKEFEDLAVEAEKSLRRAVELKSDVPETWVSLVEFLGSVDKKSEIGEIINQAREKIPAEKAPRALAICYEIAEKNDLALEQYKLALAAKPDDPAVVRSVADFYQRIGKTVEAEALLRWIIDGKVKGDVADVLWARRQLALITAAKGGLVNMENARNLIEQNLALSSNSLDDLRLRVKLDTIDPRRSRRDEAINILSKMMDGKQATPEDRFNLAMLYLSTDKQMQSRASSGSNSRGEDNKDSSAWVNASNILRTLVTSQNTEPRYLAVYAKSLLDHGDISSAELYLNKLMKDFPNHVATIMLQAQVMAGHNQYDEALDLMKSFVDMKNATPADRSTRIRMMAETMEQLIERLNSPDQKTLSERFVRTTEMFYRQYVDEHPSQTVELVMFFLRRDQTEDAMAILEQTWQNNDPTTVAQVCMNITQRGKKSKELEQRLENVLVSARTKFENHPAILLTLGDTRVNQDRFIEAEKFYREILDKNPGHAVAMNNLAVLLALQGKKLDEALSLINKAIEITGPVASMLDTRATVYIASGDAEKALKDMEESVADEASPTRLFHQAQALYLGNQKFAASSTMQQALKAGLSKEMLISLEIPSFEKLQKLPKELGTAD